MYEGRVRDAESDDGATDLSVPKAEGTVYRRSSSFSLQFSLVDSY